MAARLFVRHHCRPHLVGVEIIAALIEQRFRIGFLDPGRKPFADQSALPVAAVGIEAVPDHPSAIAHGIGDDRDEACRHLAEIDIGVADRRRDRLYDFPDVDDTDRHGVWLSQMLNIARSCPGHPVIASEAKQSRTYAGESMDCFVAIAPRMTKDASGRALSRKYGSTGP